MNQKQDASLQVTGGFKANLPVQDFMHTKRMDLLLEDLLH